MRPNRLRLGALLVLCGVTVRALLLAGDGALAAPPVSSWAAVAAWYEQVGAVVAVMSLLRLLAVAGIGWLGVALVLQVVAAASPRRGVRRLADVLSPRAVRQLAHGAASLSVTAGLSVPSLVLTASPAADPPGTAVMEVLDDAQPTTTTTTAVPLAPPPPEEPVPAPARALDEVVLEVGDSFWSVAEEAVAEARGGVAPERDVQRYWRQLIEANRDRLVVPDNPDLLFPAQRLVLPAVDPAR